jgi:beta-lactamase class A
LTLGLLAALLYLGGIGVFGQGQAQDAQEAPAPVAVQEELEQIPPPVAAAATPDLPGASASIRPRQLKPRVVPTRPRSDPPPALSTSRAADVPLSDELEAYVAELDGTYGVAVLDLEDGETVLINSEHVFPAASLYKLLVLYRMYQEIDAGRLSQDGIVVFQSGDLAEAEEGDNLVPGDAVTVADAVEWMITFSSNPAAYALARYVGGWNQVTVAATELGMDDTAWGDESFITTPADMLRFFELLGNRSLVSREASDEMIAVLLRQQIGDRLPAYLPVDAMVAHKTGNLPGVRHDAGIVFTEGGSYAIVIMSEGVDPAVASEAIAEMSRMVFDRFGG